MTKEKVFISEADQYLLPRGPIMIFTKTGCTSVGGRRRAGSLFRSMGTKCSTGECHWHIQ